MKKSNLEVSENKQKEVKKVVKEVNEVKPVVNEIKEVKENDIHEKKTFKEVMGNCVAKTKEFFVGFPKNTKEFFVNLPHNSKEFVKSIPNKKGFNSVASSLISILVGIFIGFLFMVFAIVFQKTASPFRGLGFVFGGPFGSSNVGYELGNMLFKTVPLIFTGLSVGIAYKTGLFNIGAPGQFLMGTMGALLVALSINTTGNRFAGVMVWLLAIVVAIAFAILWALIPGFLKAQFGINEVIICIMTNWIAANLVSWVYSSLPNLKNPAVGKGGFLIKTNVTGNFTPKIGLDKLFSSRNGSFLSDLDISILIAIVVGILLWVLMNKTTLGYSLKACGYNRNAAKYAGINEKLNIMIAMGIAGALAGLGGAFYYLNPGQEMIINTSATLPNYGFNGIPAALLANSNPIGIIFTSLFIRYIESGSLNLTKAGYNQNIGSIIIAIIIYLAGFSRFFSERLDDIKKFFANKKKEQEGKLLTTEGQVKQNNTNKGGK